MRVGKISMRVGVNEMPRRRSDGENQPMRDILAALLTPTLALHWQMRRHHTCEDIIEIHMCLGLACRQVLQNPPAFFTCRGQLVLNELLKCRHTFGGSLSDREKTQSSRLIFLRTGCYRTNYHREALQASMPSKMASKANSNVKRSSAPVWVDCDAGSDDALGIAWLITSPEEHLISLFARHITSTKPLQAYFWLLGQTLWEYHLYEETR